MGPTRQREKGAVPAVSGSKEREGEGGVRLGQSWAAAADCAQEDWAAGKAGPPAVAALASFFFVFFSKSSFFPNELLSKNI